MTSVKHLVAALCFAVVLSACGGRDTVPLDDLDSGVVGRSDDSGGASTSGDQGGGGIGVFPEGSRQRQLLGELVVYFNYDQFDVRNEFNELLAAHGQFLAANPNAQLRLEGHADERGSREYNIGLGERRAQAVRRILLLQGASANQLNTVSYGEERPAALGSDEEAWTLNRRVELVYRQ
jgi:peptidoglycan-associated lipoprotein